MYEHACLATSIPIDNQQIPDAVPSPISPSHEEQEQGPLSLSLSSLWNNLPSPSSSISLNILNDDTSTISDLEQARSKSAISTNPKPLPQANLSESSTSFFLTSDSSTIAGDKLDPLFLQPSQIGQLSPEVRAQIHTLRHNLSHYGHIEIYFSS